MIDYLRCLTLSNLQVKATEFNKKNNIMDYQLKEKLLKLYELSKRGVGGEKTNADVFLNRLLKKHNLTINDIDANVSKKRYYRYKTLADSTIIAQVCYRVLGKGAKIYEIKGYKELCVDVTDYQHVQLIEEIDFHIKNYRDEKKQFLNDFTNAYIQKHRLFRERTEDENIKPLTLKEKQAIYRMSAIKETLSNKTYIKKIQ